MATGNFYNDVNGIFAFGTTDDIVKVLGLDEDTELDEFDYTEGYEICKENVIFTLKSELEDKGHEFHEDTNSFQSKFVIDNTITLNVEAGYYDGAQIIIENLERAVVAEEEGLGLDEDHYKKVYAYEIEDGSDIAYTDNLADVVEAGEDVYEMYGDCLWAGYSGDEPTELPRVVVSSINHPDYTKLDNDVINALTKATTAYKVAWQASNGETAYEKMEG